MANYATSVLAKGQAIVTDEYQKPEQRRKVPTVFEKALQNEKVSIPNADDLRKLDLRTVEIYYQKDVAAGAGTAKAHNHTGSYGDSGKVELTYVTHVETMSLPRKIAQNNILTYQAMFNNQYKMKWQNLRKRHDDSALAFLLANRCQLSQATIAAQIAGSGFASNAWNETNYALEVSADKAARFAQRIKTFMSARKFNAAAFDVISDLQMAEEFEFQKNQGSGNSSNTAFQFAGLNIATTQDQISSNYGNGAVIILPAGLLAGMHWNDPLNRSGVNSGENEVGLLGTIADPFGSGAVADISMYTQRADTSANTTGGSTQDIVDQWEISLTVAYALPPMSTTGESVAHLIGQIS